MKKICAITVLYNPSNDIIKNIESYLHQVDRIFVIDNSDIKDNPLLDKIKKYHHKIYFINNNENAGVAKAFNDGMKLAMDSNFDYSLLMDQDSILSENSVGLLVKGIEHDTKAVIAAPVVQDIMYNTNVKNLSLQFVKRLTAITSGSLINLAFLDKIGYYNEMLFIDLVDHDFCLRANSRGYKIFIIKNTLMQHRLGNVVKKSILGIPFYPTNHPPVRRYYKIRNSLYVWKKYFFKYPRYTLPGIMRFLGLIINITFFEKNKLDNYRMMYRGIHDFIKNRYGKYIDNRKT